MECLSLTVEEVMHIRQVLVKAELEKYQQYKDVYTALKKGKVGLSLQSSKAYCRTSLLFTHLFLTLYWRERRDIHQASP